MRSIAVGLAAVSVVAASMVGPVSAAEPDPLIATAEWNDSTILYAAEYLQPCGKTTASTCIETAWITRAGQKVTGTPAIDTGFNWIYEFEVAGRVETYWLAMTKGKDPAPDNPNERAFVSLYLVPVQATPVTQASDSCYGGWTPDTAWCPIQPDDAMRFGVTLRSPLRASGWVDARMSDPSVVVTAPAEGRPGRFTVEGRPIRIPTLKTQFSYDDPRDREEWLKVVSIGSGGHGDSWGIIPPDWEACRTQNIFCWAPFPALTPYGFAALSKALPERLKQATGWITMWRASTWLLGADAKVDSTCVGEFNGLTASNAMTYTQYVTVDKFTRQVTFTMAGPTYDAEGKRLTGDFFMVMTEKAAQCQWGTFDIGDQLLIQVTSEDGVEAAGTASVTRRDGQIIVRATGFGFSLKQAALVQVSKGAPSAPKKLRAAAVNSTLTVAWAATPATKYRLRITKGEGVLQRTVKTVEVSKGRATFPKMAKGTYRLELVASNAQGQSPPAVASATIR